MDYVNVKKPPVRAIPELGWVENVSKLLDSQFQIPGTNFRFGLDPIIGLIPGLGPLSGLIVSGFLLSVLVKHNSSRKVIVLMSLNILADAVIGSIPLIGNLFDFGFKANNRNIKLVKDHYYEGKHQGSGTGIILGILVLFILIVGVVIFAGYKLIDYIIGLF